jgi:hypothetical protein
MSTFLFGHWTAFGRKHYHCAAECFTLIAIRFGILLYLTIEAYNTPVYWLVNHLGCISLHLQRHHNLLFFDSYEEAFFVITSHMLLRSTPLSYDKEKKSGASRSEVYCWLMQNHNPSIWQPFFFFLKIMLTRRLTIVSAIMTKIIRRFTGQSLDPKIY